MKIITILFLTLFKLALAKNLRELGFEECLAKCLPFFDSPECIECIRETNAFVLGDAQLPAGAIADLLQAKLGVGYTEMWCGKENLPTGWKKNADGTYSGCETTVDFPGNDATSHQSHSYVKREMQTYPKDQSEGKIWRGNELGFIISNEQFWPEELNPRSVLLGASPKQHAILRPTLESLYGKCSTSCKSLISKKVQSLFSQKSISVQNDLKIMVHEILMELTFPGQDIPWDVQEFIDTQSSFTTLSTLTQMTTDTISGIIETATKTKEKLYWYYRSLKTIIEHTNPNPPSERLFPLIHFDTADCGETLNNGEKYRNCVSQLASALLDTLLAAGGLSVPGALSTGVWVLYGDLESANKNPTFKGLFPPEAKNSLKKGHEVEFFYESMRMFAPVVGFPRWTTKPARATDETASQVEGGVRDILNLALANKDPNVWGSDAAVFRPRTLQEYHSNFVGFADFATDANYPEMNRACPGKTLALQIGKIFFENLNQNEWHTEDKSGYQEATPFIDEFVIYKKEEVPCPFTCSSALDLSCKFKKSHCETCHSCSKIPTCDQQCTEKCTGNCRWYDASCHWRYTKCLARVGACQASCRVSRAKCVVC